MLIIPLKCAPRYDLREPLSRWLPPGTPANPMKYTHLRPDFKSCDCQKELVRLASLRNCLSDSILKSNSHKVAMEEFALQDCHEYHAALLEFEKRGFPTRDECSSLQLEWKAAIGSESETHGSLEWDRGCILYNVAALESYQASIQGQDHDGRKQAVKHCQTAACMMRYVREEIIEEQQFSTVDLSKACLLFWENAMLAHAQLAAYQMAGNDKHAILSYLALGAVPLFNNALKYSKDPLLASHMPKQAQEWGVHCKAWSMVLSARAAFHQSIVNRSVQSWGLELAWLNDAWNSLTSCHDFLSTSKGMEDLEKQVTALMQAVKDRKADAEKDNRSLYRATVPTSLPTVQSKQLVKSDAPLPETMLKPKVKLF